MILRSRLIVATPYIINYVIHVNESCHARTNANHCNTLQLSTTLASHRNNTLQHMSHRRLCRHCCKMSRSKGCPAVCTLQDTATRCNTLQHTATHYNTLQHTATHCNTLQHAATHCKTLQDTSRHCKTLQHTATRCNTLQYCNTCVTIAFAGTFGKTSRSKR